SLFPDLEYTFKHALTHEVAYGSLLGERRRALHARIVERIEARFPDRLAEQVERLAHHAQRGEGWDKARAYLRPAGVKAAARSAHHEAVGHFEQAIAAADHLPQSRAVREQAVDIRLAMRSSLATLGHFEGVLEQLREAETLAAALGDQERLGQVYAGLVGDFAAVGNLEGAVEAGQPARAIASAIGAFVTVGQATGRRGPASY